MKNLLKETEAFISNNKIKMSEILWIGGGGYKFSWHEFTILADFEYLENSDIIFIEPSLRIMGKDFWIERSVDINKYGERRECWKLKKVIRKPRINRVPAGLFRGWKKSY